MSEEQTPDVEEIQEMTPGSEEESATTTDENLHDNTPDSEVADGETGDDDVSAASESTEEAPAFEPSFKYKVKDEEFEMDEWAKQVATDEKIHKQLQDLYSASRGIAGIKEERQQLREEASTLRQEKETMDQSLAALSSYVQKGDMRSFFEALAIPREKVLSYALEELKYQELSPEQKYEVDSQRAQQAQLNQLQMQNQQMQQQWQSQAIAQRERELDLVMSDPTTTQVASAYDARVGKPGAFKEEVIRRGQLHDQIYGQDISAKQAVEEVLNLINAGSSPTPSQAAGTSQNAQGKARVVAPKNKPTMTNVQGTGSSPAKKTYNSIADLKKRQQELAEQGL